MGLKNRSQYYRVTRNYCFIEGKWIHRIEHKASGKFIMTWSESLVKKYETGRI